METTDAVADTTEALRSALTAAHRERDALTERLATVDRLIADLDSAVRAAGASPVERAARKTTGKRAGARTTAKRAGARKAAQRGTRKRNARKGARKRQGPGRTDRVVEIVSTAGNPLSTGDVRARLQEEEPDVSSKLVSAALTYAERKGRVAKTGDGRWSAASS